MSNNNFLLKRKRISPTDPLFTSDPKERAIVRRVEENKDFISLLNVRGLPEFLVDDILLNGAMVHYLEATLLYSYLQNRVNSIFLINVQ
jgi:hypothetical protein